MSQKDFMGAEDLMFAPSPTDVIISGYENKISQNIASKTLAASKRGESPDFTKEELLYLNRKAGEDEDTELKVITPAPLVTLKKGKTELNIGHAVKLVQKMEEKYPTNTAKHSDEIWQGYKSDPIESAVTPPQIEESVKLDPTPIKTVNKNAYEIREAVLAHALGWVQYTRQFGKISDPAPTEDDVLNVAQKFYKFVENRR